ncbi:hypothetical protein SH661x_003687 [Planctomicrobium sp. SH661]|uniref:hypothetical protein n=1 Tax=Planctomicrobium sp. SH661 TaxID=3448124 RepID=UPI003F5BCE7D
MKHTIDELMLQRCVDGELSDHERTELLKRLHEQGSAENWKTLALTFVEHQVFSRVFADDAASGEMLSFQLARPVTPGQEIVPATNVPWLHRRVRPWFSVAASLLVGMMVGVAGHFWMSADEVDGNIAETDVPSQMQTLPEMLSIGSPGTGVRTASRTPIMNVRLTGLGSREAEPVSVPVYSPEQWQAIQHLHQPAPLPEDIRQMLEAQGMTVDHERQWYRAPLSDGREILVPTETMRVRHSIQ